MYVILAQTTKTLIMELKESYQLDSCTAQSVLTVLYIEHD